MKKNIKDNRKLSAPTAINRRDFIKEGAAAVGFSAATLAYLGSKTATAASSELSSQEIEWHNEADVVIVGAGAAGLPAAISAVDNGASTIIV